MSAFNHSNSIKLPILVNLAFYPGVNSDPVFDGNMATHRPVTDGRATINFDGIFYISALRIRTSINTFELHLKLKYLCWSLFF